MKKITKITNLFLISFFIFGFLGCLSVAPSFAEGATQLETREYQTRVYDTKDVKTVMKAVLNVLQDEDFIVDNANIDLGFISGTKEFDINDKTIDVKKEFGTSKLKARIHGYVTSNTEITVNVSAFGNKVKIRANFKRKLMNVYDTPAKIDEIKDQGYYQDFFAKVDKGMFIQKENL